MIMEEERRTSQDIAELREIIAQRRDDAVIEIEEKTAQMLIILLENNFYGLYGKWVKEIVPVTTITFVPGMPDYLLGVINLRGDIESVLDLRTILGMPFRPPDKQSRIAIGQVNDMRSGALVDAVEDVVDIPEDCIALAEAAPNIPARQYVIGEAAYHDRALILLDLEKIFASILTA